MIDGSKILLEIILLSWIIFVLNRVGWNISNNKFLYLFTFIALVLNTAFYILGAWPLYVTFGEQQGITNQVLFFMVIFDILKWTILVYFITRFALKVENKILGGGFIITQKRIPLVRVIPIGIIAGMIMVIVVYGMTYLLFKGGLFEKLYELKQSDVYLKLGFWGGLRNLMGEEVLTRLGVQTLVLYSLRNKSFGVILSVVLSSLYFECWHNGFKELYFLNFSASAILAIVYHKFGYESAAVGHCAADWFALCIVPYLLI